MSVVSSSVSQECTASSFRLTDLIWVNVEWMGGKKICQLHARDWSRLFSTSELTDALLHVISHHMKNNCREEWKT